MFKVVSKSREVNILTQHNQVNSWKLTSIFVLQTFIYSSTQNSVKRFAITLCSWYYSIMLCMSLFTRYPIVARAKVFCIKCTSTSVRDVNVSEYLILRLGNI